MKADYVAMSILLVVLTGMLAFAAGESVGKLTGAQKCMNVFSELYTNSLSDEIKHLKQLNGQK